jgi:hypothetical protein
VVGPPEKGGAGSSSDSGQSSGWGSNGRAGGATANATVLGAMARSPRRRNARPGLSSFSLLDARADLGGRVHRLA